MNPNEIRILKEIEAAESQDDAAFAERIAEGPGLPLRYKLIAGAIGLVGLVLVMMFPANLAFGVAGYLVLVAIGTDALRRRPVRPFGETPMQFFHRMTAGLFANTTVVEPSLD
ncbi:MAG: DUF3040 domain-containing protein [bacterium]|nr:DUF3040 domain-containing protein [bacterium]MCP4966009.1 DUF3040 domain-containing protein [bacterium]